MSTTTNFIRNKTLGLETMEPAVTPPPAGSETVFVKKPKLASAKSKKREIPEGIWIKCNKCGSVILRRELYDNLKVCPKCENHSIFGHLITARERIHALVETCSFEEMDADMVSVDILKFTGDSPAVHRLRDEGKPYHC